MSGTPRDRNKVTILIVAWFALVMAAVLWGVPHIEQSLTAEAEAVLGNAQVDVLMSGRDATLIASGSAEDAEAARAQVEAINGVRVATVEIVESGLEEIIVNPDNEPRAADPVLVDPSITLRVDRDSFTLTGSVADEETSQAVIAATIAGYGENRVTETMEVEADTHSPSWLSDPFPIFTAVGQFDLGIEIYDKTLRLTGVVPDEATRDQVVADLNAHFEGAITVEDRLVIVPVAEPVFFIESNQGSVTLRGTMPSPGEVNAIREAAERIYGAASVATWLSVDPATPAVPYLADPEAFFRAFEGRTLDFVDVDNTLTLSGQVTSEQAKTSIGAALLAVVDPRGVDNELTVVDVDEATQAAIDAINDIIGASLNFNSGSTSLGDSDRSKLDDVARILIDNPTLRVVVEGHTDDRGTEIGNQRLSEERAKSVVDYLVSVGIDPNRLSSIGFGEVRPIASNATSSGRSQNRRIDFTVEGST